MPTPEGQSGITPPEQEQLEEERKEGTAEVVREQKEKERQEILDKLHVAIDVIKQMPSAEQTPVQAWLVAMIEKTESELGDDGKYEVAIGEHSQREGIPVDVLIEEMSAGQEKESSQAAEFEEQIQKLKQAHEDVLRQWQSQGALEIDSEHQKKMAWHAVYNQAERPLQEQVEALRKEWAELDQAGKDYEVDTDQFALQSGEALRQIIEQKLEPQAAQLQEKAAKFQELKDFLESHSQGYFELRPDMQGEKQHWRTEYEAKLISKDYRSTGNEDDDYALAMEAMSKRRELILPDLTVSAQEPAIEPVIEPVPVPEPEAAVTAVTPEAPPIEPEKTPAPEKKKIHVVDISEVVKAYAWREAEEKLRDLLDKSNFVKQAFVRLGEKGYLVKFYQEALAAIQANKDLLAEIETRVLHRSAGKSTAGSKAASCEVLDSLLDEYDKELTEADEKGEVVVDANVNQAAAGLFSDFATGKITSRDEFEKQVAENIIPLLKGRKFSSDQKRDPEAVGMMYINNFWELAQGYKKQLEEKIAEYGPEQRENALNHVRGEMALDIQLGLKQRDLYETKPKETLKLYDKFVDWMQSIPILNKIAANPVAYGLIGGVAGTFVGRGVKRAAAVAGLVTIAGIAPWAAPLLAGMGFGGAFVAARRSRDLQYDRGLDLRRATLGAEVGGKRTEKIREFHYDQKQASELIAGLTALVNKEGLNRDDKDQIAEVVARLQVERAQSVDLIGVGAGEGEKYKTKAIGMKELKLALREVEQKFNLDPKQDQELKALVAQWEQTFTDNINAKDKAFTSYRRKEMAKAGVFGGIVGLAAGAVGQHVAHKVTELFGYGQGKESALEHLYHAVRGGEAAPAGPQLPSELREVSIHIPGAKEPIHLDIPVDGSLRPAGDHYELLGPNDEKVMDVFVNPDGSLEQKTIDGLKALGYEVKNNVEAGTRQVSPLEHFKDQLAEHKRIDWHDEPGQKYSEVFKRLIEFEGKQQNLLLQQEPDGTVYIDTNKIANNLVENARNLFKEFGTNPDGTVDTKLAHLRDQLIEWQENGTLKDHLQAVIIPTEEANRKGLSLIVEGASDNYLLKLPQDISAAFKTPGDLGYLHHPVRFIELRLDGHVLATTTGQNMPDITEEFSLYRPEIIPPLAPEAPVPKEWEAPPVLPFARRKALEAAKKGEKAKREKEKGEKAKKVPVEPVAGAPREPLEHGKAKDTLPAGSKEPKPEVVLNTATDIPAYCEEQEERRPGYESELDGLLHQDREPMTEETESLVVMSVAGHQEQETIYSTLKNLAGQKRQDGESVWQGDKSKYEAVLHVHWPKGEDATETLSEIERFKTDHPEVPVRVYTEEVMAGQKELDFDKKTAFDLALQRVKQHKKPGEILMITKDVKDYPAATYLEDMRAKWLSQKTNAPVIRPPTQERVTSAA